MGMLRVHLGQRDAEQYEQALQPAPCTPWLARKMRCIDVHESSTGDSPVVILHDHDAIHFVGPTQILRGQTVRWRIPFEGKLRSVSSNH